MTDGPDYHSPETPERSEETPSFLALWIILMMMLSAFGVAELIFHREAAKPSAAPVSSPQTENDSREPESLGGEPLPIDLPTLDTSDALTRQLVGDLSSHPKIVAWLKTTELIRSVTLAVNVVADGKNPATYLPALRPSGRMRVIARRGQLTIHPHNHHRYAPLTGGALSIDPSGAAVLYATLKPLMEEAHRELGYSDEPFDRTVERAIVHLLATPAVNADLRVLRRGTGYRFADADIETLSDVQKQLLRFGPRNVRLIRGALHQIAMALGIPEHRLGTTDVITH